MDRSTRAVARAESPIAAPADTSVAEAEASPAPVALVADTPDTSTYDVVLGRSTRDDSARVLLTVVGQPSADRIVTAINTASLFQCDGLKAYARQVNRIVMSPTP